MKDRKLIANIWLTPAGNILQSKHRHDFVADEQGYFVDGGLDYCRRGGPSVFGWQDGCVYSDDTHELKRETFKWGSCDGWVSPIEMTTEHIEAVLETQRQIPEHIRQLFEVELKYREETNHD